MAKLTKLVASSARKIIRDYGRERDGASAVEFAFIAPILIALYFGLAEIASAISVDRRISHSANVAGDLATQVTAIGADEMEEIMNATILVAGINSTNYAKAKMEIASYMRDSSGNPVLVGSAKLNGGVSATFDPATLDAKILTEQSGIVVARIEFLYQPLQLQFMNGNFTMSETFLLKPRKSATVEIKNSAGNVNFTCTASGAAPACSDA